MVEVSLNCLVVGEKTCFPVDIDDDEFVGILKNLIMVKKQHNITCNANSLELYRAVKGLSRDEAKAATLDKDGKIPGCIKMDELLRIQNKDHFGMNFQPEEGKIYVLVVVPVGPASTLSSALVENFDKQWLHGIVQFSENDLPNVSELEKIASGSLRIRISLGDPAGLFADINAPERPPAELIAQQALFHESPVGDTESSFHHYWDNIISDTLYLLFRGIGAKINRYDKNSTATSTYRPDYVFLLFNVCVFRGEEKMDEVDAEVPRNELIDKLQWTYDPAPYIFGYAVNGFYLCLYAIEPLRVKSKRKRSVKKPRGPSCQTHLLGRFMLNTHRGRRLLFRSLVNIAQFLKKIADLCPPRGQDYFFLDKKHVSFEQRNGVSIVKKTFPSCEASWRIEHLKLVYNEMKQHQVPNVDSLIGTGSNYVLLSPVGECISKDKKRNPKNVTELLQALVSVLEALVVLHSMGWMHRDIRWANVVKKKDSSEWFLIDFDDAAKSPKQNNPGEHLTVQEHAPEIFEDGSHTTSVDIWAVGNLIFRWNHTRPEVLDNFGLRLVDENPKKRRKAGGSIEKDQSYARQEKILARC
ncbi:hypothetical protein LEN26_000452 [Aphanomyces euteiches]|nr:hypothetical protein AeMF1_019109 [Aphanomyces euteiches]KAH9163536.1 hypothetical protein LEN26_000452 [Aphanomyces euteiches]KAH9194832.1 hypothetical protein AeNC1_003196 [Aphanomyces euteiches]